MVSAQTRSFVERRRRRTYAYVLERWRRLYLRMRASLRHVRRKILHFLCIGVLVGILAGGGMVLFSPLFTVREIRVIRQDLRLDVEKVQRTLLPLFGEHLFFVSPMEVRLLLRNAFVDIAESTLSKQYPSRLEVRIEMRPLKARLLIENASDAPEESGSGYVMGDYVTEKGIYVAYVPVQVPAADTLVPIRVIDWGVRPQPGDHLLNPLMMERMADAERMLTEQFGFAVRERVVYVRAQEFHFLTERYELWFDMRSPLDEHFRRFRLFLKEMEGEVPRTYVDLRLIDRVVYR